VQAVQEYAAALMTLAREHGFPFFLAFEAMRQGWILVEQGQAEEGIARMRQDQPAFQAAGSKVERLPSLVHLAAAHGKVGQIEEGLNVLVEALDLVQKTGACTWEAELYRLKGQLTLQSKVQGPKSKVEEAEECFQKAIEIAQRQQAKSLELRAVMSLVRLRQHQAQDHATRTTQHEARTGLDEAHIILSEVYNWFTEGFDTKDLQEATVLLEEFEGREDLPRSKISI